MHCAPTVEEEQVVAWVGLGAVDQGRPAVESVDLGDAFALDFDVAGGGNGGEQVDGADDGAAGLFGRDDARPADNARDTVAAFEGHPLHAAIGFAIAPFFLAAVGAVVGGEDNEGVVVELVVFDCLENFANAGVQLFDDVAEGAVLGLALPFRVGLSREVGRRPRQIEKEGLVFVLLNECHGFVGKFLREQAIFEGLFKELIFAPELVGLVVAHLDVIGFVEPLLHGLQRGCVAEVPLADEGGSVTGPL